MRAIGMSLEEIADLCGHSGTSITESVYRRQLRLVVLNGAVAMDRPERHPGDVVTQLVTQA